MKTKAVDLKKNMVLVLILLFPLLFGTCSPRKVADFNVVLIVIDTLRSDHLSFHGYDKNTTPFLSEIAKKSIIFENCFSTSSWTSPATASIFTSMYPFQHGVLMGLLAVIRAKALEPEIKVNKISERIETITEVFKKNNYKTFGISDNLNIGKKQGFNQGFDRLQTFNYKGAPEVNKILKKWKKEILENGKYFLYLHYMDPHAPYHHRKPWYKPQVGKKNISLEAYDSEIYYVDQYIREAFQLFNWKENTLVIVTSDHGEGLWDHGIMGHGYTLYREEIQVPLLIYLPEKKIFKRISSNVSTIDILPTVRELVGLTSSKNDEGISLLPYVENKKKKPDKRFVFSYLWKLGTEKGDQIEYKSTIYKRLHFMIKSPAERELYDLFTDKKEENNRINSSRKSARYLESKFNIFMKKCKKFNPESVYYKMSKKNIERLKTLGYVK